MYPWLGSEQQSTNQAHSSGFEVTLFSRGDGAPTGVVGGGVRFPEDRYTLLQLQLLLIPSYSLWLRFTDL